MELFYSIYSDLSPITYSINRPITVHSAIPFRKLYLPSTGWASHSMSHSSYICWHTSVCMV